MSGGFFRGTSSEQDTRFSNKQAKLMKSQKFAPELEHLVDMTKVKMDVMRPWIAKRVTELIGFEDEVVINFIYGLLEGKVVNGKEIQISLTGFMERNTGKFMKELWELLLSAQNNASGVPQQFLDAKEEETRKKKAETDRIANEIQKKRERENPELDQQKRKMDNHANNVREKTAALEPSSKHQARVRSLDDIDPVGRNGSRGRNRASRSPRSAHGSPLPRRSRSISKSFSNSRSYSGERRKSPSTSGSPKQRRGRSVSSERVYRSSVRVSFSPRRKHAPRRSSSPPRHRLRSTSRVRRRTPSPARYRRHSPFRRRSRSPIRRRSRSPMWRRSRSPRSSVRYRSRSPVRRGSPPSIRRRTPSSRQHRSPSPVRRGYHRSPSCPHSSPSSIKRKSPIFGGRRLLAPVKRRSASPVRRSLSPQGSRSPSPILRRSPSPTRERTSKTERSLVQSPRGRMRNREKYSPVQHDSRAVAEAHKRPRSLERGRPISSRSPQRDLYDSKGSRRKELPSPPMRRQSSSVSESPRRLKSDSESPPAKRERSPSEERPRSTLNQRERKTIATSPRISRGHRVHVSERNADEKEKNHSREASEHEHRSSRRVATSPDPYKDIGKGRDGNGVSEIQSRSDCLESIKRNEVMKSEKVSGRTEHPKKLDQPKSPQTHRPSYQGKRERESYDGEISKADEETSFHTNDIKGKLHVESETHLTSSRKVEQNDRSESGNEGFGFEETEKHSTKVKEKRKHRRSGRYESSSDDSYDSDVVDRKDAKRRKEERRLKKEEKRRRREERRRRKVERRAQKLKLKSANSISSPSDTERKFDGGASDDEHVRNEDPRGHEIEESVSLQKKLEVEMREKALESIRAKKGINR